MIISLIVIVLMASLSARVVQAAEPKVTANTDSFLKKAAEEQLIEIALGLLVAQRAKNDRVKDYAVQMAADHMKLSRQLEELAAKKGVKLPPGLNPEHKQKVDELSQLSGHAFDRTYMSYIIRHHENNVEEFGKDAKTLQDLDAKQWVDLTLPLFQTHREKAISIKNSLQTTP
jgi:putative membrane protein